MIQRKKKLIFFQIILFIIGLSIIIYTYYFKEEKNSEIISFDNIKKVDNKLKESQNLGEDVFLNIMNAQNIFQQKTFVELHLIAL